MLQKTPLSLVYLPAAELGITERERSALIEVRDDLASGRVKHTPNIIGPSDNDPEALGFNMVTWRGAVDCGTCHCIGGFMMARGVFKQAAYRADLYDASPNLNFLFHPALYAKIPQRIEDLTPAQAVRAIDEFLAGAGAECWTMALQDASAA